MDLKFQFNGHECKWNINNPILTKGESNLKIAKSEKFGTYSTMILHFAPSNMSGVNVCPNASEGCKATCLTFSGKGQFWMNTEIHRNTVHIARIGRTLLFKRDQDLFFMKLRNELDKFLIECKIKDVKPAMRLNGTSDIAWEKIKVLDSGKSIIELYPMIQFYDYTKNFSRLGNVPKNYFLNFSRSETNDNEVLKALEMGVNVAVPFKSEIPEYFMGYKTLLGDNTDLRFLDNKLFKNKTGKGMIVALTAKGWKAKKDMSGFVVDYKAEALLKVA